MRRGLWYMVIGAFFFSVMSALVKLAGRHIPSQELVLARGVVTLVLSYLALVRLRVPIWGNHKGWLVARGLAGFGALSCYYYAVTSLPLADAAVIQYTNPIFTAILAALFLRERLRRIDVLGAIASLAGVVLVARPSFLFGGASLDPLAVGVALCGAILSAVAYVIIRGLRGTEHEMVVVFYFPLVAVPASIPAAIPGAVWPTPLEWLIVLGIGVVTQIAQVYMTRGLHLEPAGRATSMSYLQVVFAYAWGVLVFAEYPNVTSVLGGALVLASTLIVARRAITPSAVDAGTASD